MRGWSLFVRLAGASIIASGAAGLLALPLAALGAAAESVVRTGGAAEVAANAPPVIAMLLFMSWLVAVAAIVFGTIPIFLTCGAVWAAGRHHEEARHPAAFAAAGALAGGALCAWTFPHLDTLQDFPPNPIQLLFLAAGAGGGLAFRSAMGASGELVGKA
jgi:hypothetical protein